MSAATVNSFVPVKAATGYLASYADPEFIDELNTFTYLCLRKLPGIWNSWWQYASHTSGSIVGEKLEGIDDVKK